MSQFSSSVQTLCSFPCLKRALSNLFIFQILSLQCRMFFHVAINSFSECSNRIHFSLSLPHTLNPFVLCGALKSRKMLSIFSIQMSKHNNKQQQQQWKHFTIFQIHNDQHSGTHVLKFRSRSLGAIHLLYQ